MTCTSCGRRWVQVGRLCRTCGRAAGLYSPLKRHPSPPPQRVEAPRGPRPTRCIDGVEYIVVFP